MTIYIFRHQEGENMSSNCLSKKGIRHTYALAKKIRELEPCTLYTVMPSYDGKHVRPIQTASLVCSCLCKYVNFTDINNLPSKYDLDMNHVIIWHHHDMNKIINKYFTGESFQWNDENFTGCLVINEKQWYFYPKYMAHSIKLKKISFLTWISKLVSCHSLCMRKKSD